MPELVSIPKSSFEYVAVFDRPVIALWMERAKIIQAVFDALIPWGIHVDNIEGKNDGKPAEQGVLFRLPEKNISIVFGPAQFKLTATAADWSQAEDIIHILETGLSALLNSCDTTVSTQKTSIMLHMQPKTKSFRDILLPLLPLTIAQLHSGNVRTGAVVVRWESLGITLDGSALLSNGIYMKLDRDFDSTVRLEQIAKELREDEVSAFAALGVEEEVL